MKKTNSSLEHPAHRHIEQQVLVLIKYRKTSYDRGHAQRAEYS